MRVRGLPAFGAILNNTPWHAMVTEICLSQHTHMAHRELHEKGPLLTSISFPVLQCPAFGSTTHSCMPKDTTLEIHIHYGKSNMSTIYPCLKLQQRVHTQMRVCVCVCVCRPSSALTEVTLKKQSCIWL